MDDIREVNIVQCSKGHMYSSNEYKSCPYCKKYEQRQEAEAQKFRVKRQRELHVNTRWENFKLWYNEHFGTATYVVVKTFKIITAPFRFIAENRNKNYWR
ncbi:hypothetical protein [Ruminococcus albus]|uniref:Uncharacterized protein n=1 Tax=Ruminococcus albus TaxID=1264 RepID=A0A1I1N222_RUMAL|nr:hypothetical protein [Ruminococcus albus]SFC91465.1 hypothetical protein SAMN02910406_02653 [Ruminococcus albus]